MYDDEMNGRVSGLSIVSLILSILGFTALIGFVLSIVDLRSKDGRNRVCSIIAVVISSLYLVIGLPIVIFATVVTGKVFGAFNDSKSTTVVSEEDVQITTVPDLVGLSILEASDELSSAGMTAKATYIKSSLVEKDYVVTQSIAPGTQVEAGTEIYLEVSSGP